MDESDLRGQFADLVAGFKAHLRWRAQHGVDWIPDLPSPRFNPVIKAPEVAAGRTDAPAREAPPPDAPEVTQPFENPNEPPAGSPLVGQCPEGQTPDHSTPAGLLAALEQRAAGCTACRLHRERKNVVFGCGSPAAEVMFIGEGPGREEDAQGEPFVGAAGQLLTRMIKAMGLEREQVYIANIIKCRPPRNRDPAPDEIQACEAFLQEQIKIIGPRIIVTLGAHAARTLLRTESGITRLRGTFASFQGVPLMPTYHPAFLLRNPAAKRPAWEDLQQVMARMDQEGMKRRR